MLLCVSAEWLSRCTDPPDHLSAGSKLGLKIYPRKVTFKGDLLLGFLLGVYLFACMSYVYQMHARDSKGQRTVLGPWSWSFRQVWAIMWVLGTELQFSSRAASSHKLWAISPAPQGRFLSLSITCLSTHTGLFWFFLESLLMIYAISQRTEPHCKAYCCYKFIVAIQWCIPSPTFFVSIHFL